MGFSRPEYWSGLPFPSPGDLPNPGVELGSVALQADLLLSEPPGRGGGRSLIAPVRMKQRGQRGNCTQLWMCLVVKVKASTVKNNTV